MNDAAKADAAPRGTHYFTSDGEITRAEAAEICRNNERLLDLVQRQDDFTILSGVKIVMVMKNKEDWQWT